MTDPWNRTDNQEPFTLDPDRTMQQAVTDLVLGTATVLQMAGNHSERHEHSEAEAKIATAAGMLAALALVAEGLPEDDTTIADSVVRGLHIALSESMDSALRVFLAAYGDGQP